ncbi:M28 family peptidase [Hymenobacter sp. BT770]|uniref:M28 family peptidase n=1 Tax=Hymenobacter sp. BT770 TaxID=2886942 RepID=UPI001D0F83A1|nr:M28 family peptidase [Hymenobacter sp. BT770]MCC3154442.1 M28 family peptidase [Hymenobacter sp. BT770]MDO3416313.1 M28 family peptidase [Hymenobacter sp. BT770]
MLPLGKPERPAPRPYASLPLGWAAVVLVLTLTPADKMPVTPVWELLSFDTAAHAGVFLVLAGLSWFSLRRQRRWPALALRAGRAALLGSIVFGGLIEVLQYNMALGRHGEWTDLLSDAIGAALAVGVATAGAARLARRSPLRFPAWVGLLLAGAAIGARPAPAAAQDLFRARRTIAKLASPELHGRGYVQQGEHKAAAYLRGRLRELKLQPLAQDYTQPFTLDVNTFPGKLQLDVLPSGPVRGKPQPRHLQPGRDFIAAPNSGSGKLDWGSRLVRLDTLAFTDSLVRQRSIAQLTRLPGAVLLTARDESQLAHWPALRQALETAAARITLVPKLTASLASGQSAQVKLLALPTAADWPAATTEPNQMKGVHLEVEAKLIRQYPTQNLAAIVRGSAQPDSFLVVTAHYDHLGMMGKSTYFPGANDNASGVALLLELGAHYARPENRPAYSVVFLLFGAEEAGLLGSSYFVAHPLLPLKSIKFLVNLDLLGTGEQGATVVNGKVFEVPYQRLLALNEAHHYLPALSARGRAANSDHFPFSEVGVPAFFIYTRGGSTAYHDVNDRPEALSLAGFAGAFGLVRDFLNELGAAR